MSRLTESVFFSLEAVQNFTLLLLDVHTVSLLCVHQAGLGGEEARRAQHAQRRLPDPHLISHSTPHLPTLYHAPVSRSKSVQDRHTAGPGVQLRDG